MERMSAGEWFQDEDKRRGDGRGEPLLDALLEADVADYHATSTTIPGVHRKTQSLREIPTGGSKAKGRHHRHKSSISELFMSVSSGLESIAEDVKVEARMVRESFQEGLEEAHDGRTFFLDMNLTRSLSVLPEELPMMIEETTGVHVDMEGGATPPTSTSGPYLALLGAVLAVSSNGSALSILTGVSPPLKLYWRMVATALALSFFAIRTLVRSGGLPKLSFSQWLTFVAAAVAYTGHGLLYIYALQYTSIGNVVIGANSQAILLILGKLIMGQEVVAMEGGGVFLAFCGCMLCSTDEGKDPDKENSGSDALIGDLLALSSGVFGVAYLTFAKAVRHHLPVTVFMFFVMALGSCMVLVFMAIVQKGALSFSRDPFVGLFGWMTFDLNRIYVLVHIAIICNVIGTMGFVRAMQYFDNIVIAVATLLEPLIATVIAVGMGVGQWPGNLGWIGNLVVVLGTLGVVYPSINKPMAH